MIYAALDKDGVVFAGMVIKGEKPTDDEWRTKAKMEEETIREGVWNDEGSTGDREGLFK